MALSFALIFGHPVAKSMAQEMGTQSVEPSEGSKLLGMMVKDSNGETLGTITDVVIGPEGRAAFVILIYRISDVTQKRVVIPFAALTSEGQNIVLKVTKEDLDAAHILRDDLTGRTLAEKIYRHFGVQPYWTDKETQK
jgi:sporulation protein YlmC with PRC-barrel domain